MARVADQMRNHAERFRILESESFAAEADWSSNVPSLRICPATKGFSFRGGLAGGLDAIDPRLACADTPI